MTVTINNFLDKYPIKNNIIRMYTSEFVYLIADEKKMFFEHTEYHIFLKDEWDNIYYLIRLNHDVDSSIVLYMIEEEGYGFKEFFPIKNSIYYKDPNKMSTGRHYIGAEFTLN